MDLNFDKISKKCKLEKGTIDLSFLNKEIRKPIINLHQIEDNQRKIETKRELEILASNNPQFLDIKITASFSFLKKNRECIFMCAVTTVKLNSGLNPK
jgi:hypothetical protein